MLSKVLVANRGEIAVRIIRACRELGVGVAVAHSEADRESLAVRLADEAVCVGPAASDRSYLNIPNIVSAALVTGCDAVHPGYGFLSENAYLAEVVEQCGLTFIGPPPGVIELLGDKLAARRMMQQAGVPTVPGSDEPMYRVDDAVDAAREIGYPLMIKAVAGGGGRGIRAVADNHDTTLAMGERDCTLQRRRQKILEEAPSPSLDPTQRTSINDLAARGA